MEDFFTKQHEKHNESKKAEPTQKSQIDQLKDMASYYEEKGENQLIKDIFKNVITQKKNGTLSNEQIATFAKKVSPLLNSEQRSRLNSLIEELLQL